LNTNPFVIGQTYSYILQTVLDCLLFTTYVIVPVAD
jgi:hypothetical protein